MTQKIVHVNVFKLNKEKKAFEIANLISRCCHSFPSAIRTKLYNFGRYILPKNSRMENRTTLRF